MAKVRSGEEEGSVGLSVFVVVLYVDLRETLADGSGRLVGCKDSFAGS